MSLRSFCLVFSPLVLALFISFVSITSTALANADDDFCFNSDEAAVVAGVKFWCGEKCPAPPTGSSSTYVALNCTCKKDKAAGTCTPSGKCDEYVSGQKTGYQVNCECDKNVTSKTDKCEQAKELTSVSTTNQ